MKSIIIIAILILNSSLLNCQIYVGLKGAYSPSTFHLKDSKLAPNFNFSGYSGGVIVEIPFPGGFSIQPEVQFSVSGAKLALDENNKPRPDFQEGLYYADDGENGGGADIINNGLSEVPQRFSLPNLYEVHQISLRSIETFILLKYESTNKFYFELGPYYTSYLSGQRTIELVDNENNKESSSTILTKTGEPNNKNYTKVLESYGYNTIVDPFEKKLIKGEEKAEIKKTNFGICAGIGIYKDIGDSRLYFDFRYLKGLGNILDRTDLFYGTSATTSSIQLSVTYLFPLGGE